MPNDDLKKIKALKLLNKAKTLYHGSNVSGLTQLDPRPSHLTSQPAVFASPDRALAISNIPRWSDSDFEQGRINDEPFYMREQYQGAIEKLLKNISGTLYHLPSEDFTWQPNLMHAESISHKSIKPIKEEKIKDVLKELQRAGWNIEKKSRYLYSFIPQTSLDTVKRYGLMGGKNLLDYPDALSATAKARNRTPEEYTEALNEALKEKEHEHLLGPNVLFQLPPSSTNLSPNHPTKTRNLSPIKINLSRLLKDLPDTRLFGMELEPYNESKHTEFSQRHRYLGKKKIKSLLKQSPEQLWQYYNDLTSSMYAPDVPHASIHTPTGIVPPKYLKFTKSSVLGIPDRSSYPSLSNLQPNQLVDYILHRHQAERAGLHHDLRFGTPETGLYSWAVRKGMPSPGKKHLAALQPQHSHEYGSFEGTIPEGYGKGKVTKEDEGKILLTKISPTKVHFTLAHKKYPERFVLVKTPKLGDKNWLLMNTTPTSPLPYGKVHYKTIPGDKVEEVLSNLQEGSSVQEKIDGAASLTNLLKDKLEVLSYRTSKVTQGPITHTERVLGTVPDLQVPSQYRGSVLRGEVYGTQNDQAIPPQQLSGLLNSSVSKSLTDQKQRNIQLKNMIYDVQQIGKKQTSFNEIPYEERINTVRKILKSIKGPDKDLIQQKFHLPREAKSPSEAIDMWKQILNKQNPLTDEGVIIHPPLGKPSKAKAFEESDVYIRGFFPGKGKYKDKGIGGFIYSHEPKGNIAGEIGTGFDDATRFHMHKSPSEYLNRRARIRHTGQMPSGALFQPSLISLHEDY